MKTMKTKYVNLTIKKAIFRNKTGIMLNCLEVPEYFGVVDFGREKASLFLFHYRFCSFDSCNLMHRRY